jgi:hypothetical protein
MTNESTQIDRENTATCTQRNNEVVSRRLSYTAPINPKKEPNNLEINNIDEIRKNKVKTLEIESSKRTVFRQFRNILSQAKNINSTVVIDWLSVYFITQEDTIPEPEDPEKEKVVQYSEHLVLVYSGTGNKNFKYLWSVMYKGINVATVLSHTRSVKFIKKGVVKVDYKNHLFYTDQLWPVYDMLVKKLNLRFKNVSRLDIAFDGLNYLYDFCNAYVKQDSKKKIVELKGRTRINSKVLDRQTMKYQNFNIGAQNSSKFITIYNKSLDIVKTRKEYIQQFWLKNGILKNRMPLDVLCNNLKRSQEEKIYLEGYENIFRFEIRLKSEALNEIRGFKIDMLRDTNSLVSIVKLHVRSFFDAVYLTDNNKISRCINIDLLPFSQFKITPLEKVELKDRNNIYKSKLAINLNVKNLFSGKFSLEEATAKQAIINYIELCDLQKWFMNKYENEWLKTYPSFSPNETHTSQVKELIQDIINQI